MGVMTESQTLKFIGVQATHIRELAEIVHRAEPAAVVVEPHVITRVIKHHCQMTGLLVRVPHEQCYFAARETLAEIADADELHVDDIRRLPETVILLSCPALDDSSPMLLPQALLALQRQLFHMKVHLAIQHRIDRGVLTAAVVRQRIHRIGQTEFDEVRFVLRGEHLLLPPRDNVTVYAEFAATYLELRHFARHLLPRYFPTIWHARDVEAILADDVDVPALLAQSRIEGAGLPADQELEVESSGGPGPQKSAPGQPCASRRLKLLARAERARKAGNVVRAAILHTQAAGVDRQESFDSQCQVACDTLDSLADRLREVLQLDEDQYDRWRLALRPLLPGAARGYWPVEARLLYELQKACVDHERELFSLDAIQWGLGLGRHPFKRPLPVKRQVLIARHFRGASEKLPAARLEEPQRLELLSLLRLAVRQTEDSLRAHLRGLLAGAMTDVGLIADSGPETVARDKIIEELLDRVLEQGFLTMGDLRDAISRNSLKLPDLGGPLRPKGRGVGAVLLACVAWFLAATANFFRGGKFLRLDRKLSFVLDGAYHRGEVYMRWLHRISLLAFGTWLGRVLTRTVLVPFGGAFIILEGLRHIMHSVLGPIMPISVELMSPESLVALGLYLLALVNLSAIRIGTRWFFRNLFRLLRLAFFDAPRWLVRRDVVQRVLRSRPCRIFQAYILSPLLVTCLAWAILRSRKTDQWTLQTLTAAVFLVSSLLLNTRAGRRFQEVTAAWVAHAWQYARRNILWGTFQIISEAFKRGLEMLERLLYSIDEWLRFRAGGSMFSVIAKAAIGVPWFIVSYVVRFVVNLLIEPQVNPVKHFPVVTVSHKLLLPTIPSMATRLESTVGMSHVAANTVATTIIGSIPGFFGFLVWELVGNWRLYQANRPRNLSRSAVGSHGESMVRLMKPGLHSGTLPKLYAKMRHAEAKAVTGSASRKLRKLHRQTRQIEQSVRRFTQRELVRLLSLSRAWGAQAITVGEVRLGSNRIAVELQCPSLNAEALWLSFEEQSGWLLAGVTRSGWLAALSDRQRQTLAVSLAGFYKAAGVDMIREQIQAILGSAKVPYDIAENTLVVWPSEGEPRATAGGYETEVVYDLNSGRRRVPRMSDGRVGEMPTLDARMILFRDIPISWSQWQAVWRCDQDDATWPAPIARGTRILPPAPDQPGSRCPTTAGS